MVSDPDDLFHRCHRLYVQGMRRTIRERLVRVYGEQWWDLGVWPTLSDNQRELLQVGMEREKRADLADYLDSGHFAGIVSRNHASAFKDAFPDLDSALHRFRQITYIRNEWAHVSPGGLSSSKVETATESMVSLLVALRIREGLEVDNMRKGRSGDQDAIKESAPVDDTQIPTHDNTKDPQQPTHDVAKDHQPPEEDTVEALTEAPRGLWHELRSYLAVDSFLVESEDDKSDQTQIKARVSNVAPVSEGRPDICFEDVVLRINDQSRHQKVNIGRLEPGQSIEREFTYHPKELASVVYDVEARIDAERFFRFHRSAGPPKDVVLPLLQEFTERFRDIQITEPLDDALAAVQSVDPEMSLADAAEVRQKLANARHLISDKVDGLQQLFRDFRLNKQMRLGAQCHEVWKSLQELGTRIEAVDTAIGSTDLSAVTEAVHSLEELQMVVLQVEDETRSLGAQ